MAHNKSDEILILTVFKVKLSERGKKSVDCYSNWDKNGVNEGICVRTWQRNC